MMKYWQTSYWPYVQKGGQGVYIHVNKRNPEPKAIGLARKLRELIHTGDIVFIYETENHPYEPKVHGRKKIVAMVQVTPERCRFKGREDEWITVRKTKWLSKMDCPLAIAREITGIWQLGTMCNYGHGQTNVQDLGTTKARQLMDYVVDIEQRRTLIRKYFSDELDDESYQQQSQSATADQCPQGPIPPEWTSASQGSRVKRKSGRAQDRFFRANYKCEVNSKHVTFTWYRTPGNQYVEAHHLVPVAIQEEFENGLDHVANIIALCPNCHKRLHHANSDEKRDTLKRLFRMRKKELQIAGISLTVGQLLGYYK